MDKLKKRMLLTACFLLAVFVLPAFAASVHIVIPAENPAMLNLAKAAQHALQQIEPATAIEIRTPASSNDVSADTLLIVMGDDTLDWVQSPANPYQQMLYFYVSSIDYYGLQAKSQQTALFRDQPLVRQLHLAALILPSAHRALIVHRPEQFAGAAPRHQQPLPPKLAANYRSVDPHTDWIKSMALWVSQNDVLIGVDDKVLYNRDSIRSILLTTYRQGKVLIGPNRGFVNAGSLASVYSSPEHYLQQLQTMVKFWLDNRSLPAAQFPREFQLVVNRQVADSLGLALPDDPTLLQLLRQRLQKAEACADGC